ncbi:MAG: ATP phosphoribosyltransferase regulatory subunit, partial [Candidatus Angelobacter sp.]
MVGLRFENVTKPLTGFLDLIGLEVRIMRFLQVTFSDLFSKWGYGEIMVPIVERASSFSEEVIGGSPWPEWDKRSVFYVQLPSYDKSYSDLPTQEPALLVPEGTISVSRWLASVYEEGTLAAPRKIFYIMPCFRNELISKLSATKGRQFHQAGIEILGTDNVRADLEVLLIAHEGFVKIGVPKDSILVRIGSE